MSIICPATFYYRHSRDIATKRKVIIEGQATYTQTELTNAVKKELNEFVESYRGTCINCHKSIQLTLVDDGYYDVDQSGRTRDREELNKLMIGAENGAFNFVITLYSSRIGRDVAHTKTIRKDLSDYGIQVISKNEQVPIQCPDCYDPLNNDSALIIESTSDMTSDLQGRSVRRNYKVGMSARHLSGRPLLGMPYGLMKKFKVAGQDLRGNDVIDEYYEWDKDKANVVKQIAEEYLSGTGTRVIAKRLNQQGVPSPQGKKWGRSAIIVVLENPIYAGVVRTNWKPASRIKKGPRSKRKINPFEKWSLKESSHVEPLYNWDTYERIRKTIESKAIMKGRAAGSPSLLVGLLKCGYCGHPMFQGKTTRKRPYGNYIQYNYHCGQWHQTGECYANGVAQHIVDDAVMNEVTKLIDETTKDEFAKHVMSQTRETIEDKLAMMNKTLSELEGQVERAWQAYLEGKVDISRYTSTEDELKNKRLLLEGQIKVLQDKMQNRSELLSVDESFKKAVTEFRDAQSDESKRKVKMILSRLIERIDYKGDIGNKSPKKRKRDVHIVYKVDFI